MPAWTIDGATFPAVEGSGEVEYQDLTTAKRMFSGRMIQVGHGSAATARRLPLESRPILRSIAESWYSAFRAPGTFQVAGDHLDETVACVVKGDPAIVYGPTAQLASVSVVFIESDPEATS